MKGAGGELRPKTMNHVIVTACSPSLQSRTVDFPTSYLPPPRQKQPQLQWDPAIRDPIKHHGQRRRHQQQQHAQVLSPPTPPHHPQDPQPTTKPNSNLAKFTVRARLSQLCKEGHLDAARRLLSDSLARPSLTPASSPTLLWNTLLIGYVCNSLPHEALRLYALMNSSSCADASTDDGHFSAPSDAYTYSSVLKACADSRQLMFGKSVHCHIIRRSSAPPKNRVLNNSLLNMYASTLLPETLSLDTVRLVFDRMPKRNVVAWNTLIAWYIKCRRPGDALARLRLMLEAGMRPTPVTFINVFPAVKGVDSIKYCDVLYGLLVKCGGDYLSDQFVVSSAILAYSELSDLQSARRVFDQTEDKNTKVWNTMISGYVQNGRYSDALVLLVQILESDVVDPDTVTTLSSLIAVSQLQDLQLGKQIHTHLIVENSSLQLPLVLCNALLVMYARCGEISSAFELFERMPQRDVVSWNTMVSALVQNDLNFEGLLLVHEMQKEGFHIDSVTATALLSAASDLGRLAVGKETHGYLIRHGIKFDGMESYLIDMYAKSGSVEVARRLFDKGLPDDRDKVTWNAMIAGYTQSGQTEEAIAVFKDMLKECQVPNAVTIASVLPACSPEVGGVRTGKQIHGFAFRHCLHSNVFVGTALVDLYSRCGHISLAERVFDGMRDKNTVTYTTMLSGFGQHGLGEKALGLFRRMRELGVRPDPITFVALISACSYSGLVDEGLAVYESMKDFGLVTTPEHHCCVVDLLGRAGRVEEAYEFAQMLGDEGNFAGIWGSLLAACKVHGKPQLGELVAEKLFELEKENGLAGYHVLLSNVYAADRNWDGADRVRKEMRVRGLRKEPGSSWIEVGDSSHRFMSRDQMHPENDRIRAMLRGLTLDMRSTGYGTLEHYPVDEVSNADQQVA